MTKNIASRVPTRNRVSGKMCFTVQKKSTIEFNLAGTPVGLPGLVRDIGLIIVTLVSLKITPTQAHLDNQFSWGPMQEVAKLFAGIFLTIIPVIAMLKAGVNGPFGAVVSAVTHADGSPNPAMYFWATGALSSFLDNAPTYLVFFNTAGGASLRRIRTGRRVCRRLVRLHPC